MVVAAAVWLEAEQGLLEQDYTAGRSASHLSVVELESEYWHYYSHPAIFAVAAVVAADDTSVVAVAPAAASFATV